MTDAPRESIEFPDDHGVKPAAVRIGHEFV
jgi:hypothetical protein